MYSYSHNSMWVILNTRIVIFTHCSHCSVARQDWAGHLYHLQKQLVVQPVFSLPAQDRVTPLYCRPHGTWVTAMLSKARYNVDCILQCVLWFLTETLVLIIILILLVSLAQNAFENKNKMTREAECYNPLSFMEMEWLSLVAAMMSYLYCLREFLGYIMNWHERTKEDNWRFRKEGILSLWCLKWDVFMLKHY